MPAPAATVSQVESKARFPVLPAYDQALKCSNLFNLLDARGAISVTERVGIIGRVRKLAVGVAEAWVTQQNPPSEPDERQLPRCPTFF